MNKIILSVIAVILLTLVSIQIIRLNRASVIIDKIHDFLASKVLEGILVIIYIIFITLSLLSIVISCEHMKDL